MTFTKKVLTFFGVSILIILLIDSCDETKNLGNGYFTHLGSPHFITCENREGATIPENVESYDYDGDFIIAKQRPANPNVMFADYDYKNGRSAYYYWMILKDKHKLIGPATQEEFEGLRKEYNVTESLDLEE